MPSRAQIADLALLGDCCGAGLVGVGGSLDWLCLPRFDSPSVFARLLDPDGGHWSICPTGAWTASRRYLPGTLVLETTFTTPSGTVLLVDALAFAPGAREHELGLDVPHEVLRVVRAVAGEVELALRFAPRPEYGLSRPVLEATPDGVRTFGGPDRLALSAEVELVIDGADARADFSLRAGEQAGFALRWTTGDGARASDGAGPGLVARLLGAGGARGDGATPPGEVGSRLDDTIEAWRSWERAHDRYEGPSRELVRTSSRVLKALAYRPTGAVVAAATTSLPETLGGERNWDYRFAWIRDASLTFEALWIGTCPREVEQFVDWMAAAAGGHARAGQALQIMYGVAGERDLPEREIPHLRGFRDSRPVRVGNGAHDQRQLDVYGEFLNVVALYAERLGDLDPVVQRFVAELADTAAREWTLPDAGLWEARSAPRHHVSSKLFCWLALERATELAERIGAGERRAGWAAERDRIRAAILERGWSERRGAFVQAFDGDELDASALLMPLVGFLPADDPRMRATIEAVAAELGEDGLILRYRSKDGLEGKEGTFLLCSFWLVSCLARLGEVDRARALFERTAGFANDVGLLGEEVDARTGELLGNFPQAFSHVGLITAARDLDRAAR
jgi:GH15 family glucan-1,4-alpha-glucosidase